MTPVCLTPICYRKGRRGAAQSILVIVMLSIILTIVSTVALQATTARLSERQRGFDEQAVAAIDAGRQWLTAMPDGAPLPSNIDLPSTLPRHRVQVAFQAVANRPGDVRISAQIFRGERLLAQRSTVITRTDRVPPKDES